MISLFTLAPNDQSVAYLAQIFGNVSVLPSDISVTLIGTLFKTLNTTALVLGSILVVYTTVIGLVKTASEGEFLGKQWSSLWVPLRMVMGIAALFPTAAGYSALQVAMMWFIMQGVGAADTLWGSALEYINVVGSPYASVTLPETTLRTNIPTLFQALTCQATAHQKSASNPPSYSNSSGTNNYFYCDSPASSTDSFCNATDITNIITEDKVRVTKGVDDKGNKVINYAMGPLNGTVGSCGTLQYGDPDGCESGTDLTSQVKCAALKAQQLSLQAIVTTYGLLGSSLAQADNDYIPFYENTSATPPAAPTWIRNYCNDNSISESSCCVYQVNPALSVFGSAVTSTCYNPDKPVMPGFPPVVENSSPLDYTNTSKGAITRVYWPYYIQDKTAGNFIPLAVNGYIAAVTDAVNSVILSQPPTALERWQQAARDQGWILAGAFYYKMVKISNSNLDAAMPSFKIFPGDQTTGKPVGGDLSRYRNNYEAAANIIQMVSPGGGASTNPSMAAGTDALSSSSSALVKSFMDSLTSSKSNPLVAMANFGHMLIWLGISTWTALMIVLTALVAGTVFAGTIILGTGSPSVATLGMFLGNILYGVSMALVLFCLSFGGLLSVYTPLIPYIIFVFAAIGWFMAVIEAMVATPFIALGILAPGGQSEMLGHANPTVMMLLNIFLRPSLMIMGMMFAMLLAPIVITLINTGFGSIMNAIVDPHEHLIGPIFFMIAYAYLVIGAMNKTFSLITWLPNNVLTWIGGHAKGYGEEEAAGGIKGDFQRGTAEVGRGAQGLGDQTKAVAGKQSESNRAKDEKNKADTNAGTTDGDATN